MQKLVYKFLITEEAQNFEDEGLMMSAMRPSPYANISQPLHAWHSQYSADWSGTPGRPFLTSNMRERRVSFDYNFLEIF